jgi:DUF4097 and DUF4098 domain-containing protein YvlB
MAEEKWLVSGPKTIDLENVRRLKLGLVGGQVDIVAHDEPGARVEVHSVTGGKDLKITYDGDTLEIDHAQLGWDNWLDVFRNFSGKAKADVSIMVPADIALKFGVVSANGLISGLSTDASISTVSGDLVLDGVTGDITLNSVSGEVAVRNHTGRITAHTVSGDVTVTGAVQKFSVDGVSADVFLDLNGAPDQVRINTVSGNTTLRLPEDIAAQYTINTVSGRLQIDASEVTVIRGRYTAKHGELDRQWLDFSANTVSGDVSVMHAVRA